MDVLVDTSVWIDFLRGGDKSKDLEFLIDENFIATNELIMAELIPYLKVRRQRKLIALLRQINLTPVRINWDEIIDFQIRCLKSGENGIGIPDLVIAQNAKQHGCAVYSLDKHFFLLKQITGIALFPERSEQRE